MLRKPLFWIVLIIILAIIWFVWMGRQHSTVVEPRTTPATMTPDTTNQPAQPPATTPSTDNSGNPAAPAPAGNMQTNNAQQ